MSDMSLNLSSGRDQPTLIKCSYLVSVHKIHIISITTIICDIEVFVKFDDVVRFILSNKCWFLKLTLN